MIILGDCLTELRSLADESVDSIVTDPPYGLSFMGKKWDYDVPGVEVWKECFRVLKPGGHLLSFFGSRTYHRGVIPIEDAGFEIRDQIMWVYGSGFPKSHNIGKAVDKLQGNEREYIGENPNKASEEAEKRSAGKCQSGRTTHPPITKGNTEHEGWGTALKPAHEPIVVARKPVQGTVAENVLRFSTGGMNIDGCRVETESRPLRVIDPKPTANGAVYAGRREAGKGFDGGSKAVGTTTQGRFPANVIHDGVDEPWGRYFYCAKASKKDRGENNHPTVKPTDLMRYLCRLVTPSGGVVLDPFMGSGSTGKAAQKEGFEFIGIEREPEYVEIARQRI